MNDIQLRVIALIASGLAGWGAQHLGIDQHSADIVSTAIVTGCIGWVTKFITEWRTPSSTALPPPPPASKVG